jgi:putative transposase
MAVPEARRPSEVEDENRRIKRLVADQALDAQMLKEALAKKVVTPEVKRSVVGFWRASHDISERRACRLLDLCRATLRYVKRPDRNLELRVRLRALTEQRRRFGYGRLHVLLGRDRVAVNLKPVRRLYRKEGLSLRARRGRRRFRGIRVVPALPIGINQRWTMDFMSDALADGRRFRVLNVVDDFSRECLAAEAGRSLTGRDVVTVLARLVIQREIPQARRERQRPGVLQPRCGRLGTCNERAAALHPPRQTG